MVDSYENCGREENEDEPYYMKAYCKATIIKAVGSCGQPNRRE